MKRTLVLCVLAIVVFLGVACGGDSKGSVLPSSSPAPSGSTPSAAVTAAPAASPTTPPQANAPADLSLVYIDTRVPATTALFVAKYDGSSAKQVGTLPQGVRPLDMRGGTLALTNGPHVLFADLKTGATKTQDTLGDVRDGKYLDDSTFLYTTAGGCGGGPTGGPPASRLWRLDLKTMTPKELTTGQGNTIAVIGIDPAKGQVAILKRGCDPGIGNFFIIDANTGAEIQKVDSLGCGYEVVSLEKKLSFVANCSSPSVDPPNVNAKFNPKVINFAGATPVNTDVKTPPGTAPNNDVLALRPVSTQVAVGTAEVLLTPKPGGPRSTGLFLVDMTNGSAAPLIPPDGAEQYPVSWSPDGRFLLAASVQAQGVCSFSFFDSVTRVISKVEPALTVCGTNGWMAGWTKISN